MATDAGTLDLLMSLHVLLSGNLLFGGSKVGQRESDYFSHCQCTSMTERMPRLIKPFVKKFWEYSDYPVS